MKKRPKKTSAKRPPEIIGWRETIALPELGIESLAAKIDTGARTSALHVVDPRVIEENGGCWVDFMIPRKGRRPVKTVRAPLVDRRDIKNTSGEPESRLIIQTLLLIGRHRWHVEVSLANRENMAFDLILGRTAIRRRGILVDPGRSFVLPPPIPGNDATQNPTEFSNLVRQMEGKAK